MKHCAVCQGYGDAICVECAAAAVLLKCDPYRIQAMFGFFRDEGIWTDLSTEVDLLSWYWIEGEKENSKGELVWHPLYCTKTSEQANRLLAGILRVDERSGLNKEEETLLEYDDFRVKAPDAQEDRPRKKNKKGAKRSVERLDQCPRCGSKDRKKVRKGDLKLWKCLDCRTRWARSPGEAPAVSSRGSESRSGSPGAESTKKKGKKTKKRGKTPQ